MKLTIFVTCLYKQKFPKSKLIKEKGYYGQALIALAISRTNITDIKKSKTGAITESNMEEPTIHKQRNIFKQLKMPAMKSPILTIDTGLEEIPLLINSTIAAICYVRENWSRMGK